jgi:hypothetical protein
MKTKFVLASLFAAISGFASFATPAKAGTDVHLNIRLGPPKPVIVVPARGHDGRGYGYTNRDYRDTCPPPAPRGYWKEVTVKVWVPARWVVSRDHCGREVRVYERAYPTYKTERVWVSHDDRGHHHGRGSYGRHG